MERDIEEVLINQEKLAERVGALAEEIASDYEDDRSEHVWDELTIIAIPTGSLIFLADLIRCLPLKMRIRLVTVSSYPGRSTSTQGPELVSQIPEDLGNQYVLIVDDILDSGKTIQFVRELIGAQGPAVMRTCVLLRKKIASAMAVDVDYVGFDIEDRFVVGYGLDFDDYYRNLPEVVTLRPEVIG